MMWNAFLSGVLFMYNMFEKRLAWLCGIGRAFSFVLLGETVTLFPFFWS